MGKEAAHPASHAADPGGYRHLPLVADMPKLPQTQRPFWTHRPWVDEITGLSLQVWSMPTVQVEPGPTQP